MPMFIVFSRVFLVTDNFTRRSKKSYLITCLFWCFLSVVFLFVGCLGISLVVSRHKRPLPCVLQGLGPFSPNPFLQMLLLLLTFILLVFCFHFFVSLAMFHRLYSHYYLSCFPFIFLDISFFFCFLAFLLYSLEFHVLFSNPILKPPLFSISVVLAFQYFFLFLVFVILFLLALKKDLCSVQVGVATIQFVSF